MFKNFTGLSKRICCIVIVITGFLVLLPGSAYPVDPWFSINFSVSGLAPPIYSCYETAVKDNYAYCVSSNRLHVFDISNPAVPLQVGSYRDQDSASGVYYSIKMVNNKAYILCNNGLIFMDISNPAAPAYLGKLSLPEKLDSLGISGKYACMGGNSQSAIYIADISGSTPPSSYFTYDTGVTINTVCVSGNYLYAVAKSENKVLVLNISNPNAVKQVSEFYCSLPNDIYISGKYAYVAAENEFLIFDVSTPSAPMGNGTYSDNDYNYQQVYVSGSLAFLADSGSMVILDVSDKFNPKKKSTYDYPGTPYDFVVSNNLVYISDTRGLRIVNISTPSSPSFISSFENYGADNALAIGGNYLYCGRSYGLLVADISSPASPTWLGGTSTDEEISQLAVGNNCLYAIAEIDNKRYFRVYSLADPAKPVKTGQIRHSPDSNAYIKIIGSYAYVGGEEKLVVYDVSNPAAPVQATSLQQESVHMATYGSYGYLAYQTSLYVLDISSPASPSIVNQVSIEPAYCWAMMIAIKGKYAYIAGSSGVTIYDLSDPLNPVFARMYYNRKLLNNEYVMSISIVGKYVFVRDKVKIEMADLSTPLQPETMASFTLINTLSGGLGISIEKDNCVYESKFGGISILKYVHTQTVPKISVNRSTLYFGAIPDTSNFSKLTQSVNVTGTGSDPLFWDVANHQAWSSYSPGYGMGSGKVEISVSPSYLTIGSHSGTMTIHNRHAIFNTADINIDVQVYDPSNTTVPFGEMATPINNSVARGSIPVTGWVLDDIGVTDVKLYNGSNYIGDAVFVEGARPDVEQAYPTFPFNYRAGWGYMLLTNYLPNNGNGTFKIKAVAMDVEGNAVTLGTKTIICDNANAVLPFGALDTPTQGGAASGDGYINWGWTLTPMPNSIPTDGSTITVYVDGVPAGHPVYNVYREDIASFFPGYANSNGAVGYFYLDTTQYDNGVHSIQWTVKDNAGNTDGIGSRYFTITNSGSSRITSDQTDAAHSRNPSGLHSMAKLPVKRGRLDIKRDSLPEGQMESFYDDEDGSFTIFIRELERIEIAFPAETSIIEGYSLSGASPRPLPVGSTLDRETNKFHWFPGPGFLGQHRLVFIENTDGRITRRFITILIEPF